MRGNAGAAALLLATAAAAHGGAVTVVWSGPPTMRRAALTFDDGPHPERTARILRVLRAHGVRATFFPTGEALARGGPAAARLLAEAARDGHEIGNHTYSHRPLANLTPRLLRSEIDRCADAVERATGARPHLLRPPGGGLDVGAIRAVAGLDDEIEAVVLWDADPQDWRGGDAWAILDSVAEQVRPGSIILLHDPAPATAEALPVLIEYLRAEGYDLVTVSELLDR